MMKRLMFSVFSVYIFAALLLPGITSADTPKIIRKIEPPKIVPKKLMADLCVKSVKLDPSCPRAGKDMIQIKVTIINSGTTTVPKICSWAMSVRNISTHPEYMHQVIP